MVGFFSGKYPWDCPGENFFWKGEVETGSFLFRMSVTVDAHDVVR